MLAIVCPGQGAQSPGMLASWLELDEVRTAVGEYSEASGLDLAQLGTVADADAIRDTAVAQPLLVATALATYAALGDISPGVVAGHSVGEFAAAAVARVLSRKDAVALVRERGVAMAHAAAESEATSMAAVLGGVEEEVALALAELDLTAANMNGGGQVVAAGSADAIAALVANPPARSRVIELQVAGAFHTHYMAPAVSVLEEAAATTTRRDPDVALLSNADGSVVTSGDDVVSRLVAQVARPVRWDLCMETMLSMGVAGIIELAPGGVLTGLAKRGMKGVPSVALKTPDDLAAALELARNLE
ncbi:ACP S-malonyltransferase [Demequina sp. TTPB684]|uniref:ACP S-malonyltransferase n=1 Tax=unclassified Demequina TaxID=2620311 RepID=UPI001CF1209E|nr:MULTISPECIES: ACP S-malonyltransferase [unclassified Demequina]MCB2414050.1 ACP S-malonyltransferase [Demequina sp. TTPB684]UPU89071.1 ACP S-malonyltransferase [Demequina sp. TMPB413]